MKINPEELKSSLNNFDYSSTLYTVQEIDKMKEHAFLIFHALENINDIEDIKLGHNSITVSFPDEYIETESDIIKEDGIKKMVEITKINAAKLKLFPKFDFKGTGYYNSLWLDYNGKYHQDENAERREKYKLERNRILNWNIKENEKLLTL